MYPKILDIFNIASMGRTSRVWHHKSFLDDTQSIGISAEFLIDFSFLISGDRNSVNGAAATAKKISFGVSLRKDNRQYYWQYCRSFALANQCSDN